MFKKAFVVLLVFYLIGFGGVTVGIFAEGWGSDWDFEIEFAEAAEAAARWPLLAVDMLSGD